MFCCIVLHQIYLIGNYFLQDPSVHDFTPAQAATQALLYVFPSQPQTGLYSIVQIQPGFGGALQTFICFVVLHEVISKTTTINNLNLLCIILKLNRDSPLKISFYFNAFS